MKIFYVTVIAFLFSFVFLMDVQAQPFGGRGGEKRSQGPERLERFRKMRLVEELKLSEEESVRFFAKQSAHEDKISELTKKRNDILDDMQKAIDTKGDGKEVQKLSDQILELDQKIFAERQRFQQDVRGLLTAEQFAKMLIFERNFGRQVRDAMDEMRRDKRSNRHE